MDTLDTTKTYVQTTGAANVETEAPRQDINGGDNGIRTTKENGPWAVVQKNRRQRKRNE